MHNAASLFDVNLHRFRLDSVRDHCQLVMADGNHVGYVEDLERDEVNGLKLLQRQQQAATNGWPRSLIKT
jgi:hypothetical protein